MKTYWKVLKPKDCGYYDGVRAILYKRRIAKPSIPICSINILHTAYIRLNVL